MATPTQRKPPAAHRDSQALHERRTSDSQGARGPAVRRPVSTFLCKDQPIATHRGDEALPLGSLDCLLDHPATRPRRTEPQGDHRRSGRALPGAYTSEDSAILVIGKERKTPTRGRVVAGLSFGFWRALSIASTTSSGLSIYTVRSLTDQETAPRLLA
jgi:hypothetical protein